MFYHHIHTRELDILNTLTHFKAEFQSFSHFSCVQATDPDLGASGQVHYRLVNHQKLFSINATGVIKTEVPLDREVRGNDGCVLKWNKIRLETISLCLCSCVGESTLLSDRWSLGWSSWPSKIQINFVRHCSGCGWQQPNVHPTNLQCQPTREQPQRYSHFTVKGGCLVFLANTAILSKWQALVPER